MERETLIAIIAALGLSLGAIAGLGAEEGRVADFHQWIEQRMHPPRRDEADGEARRRIRGRIDDLRRARRDAEVSVHRVRWHSDQGMRDGEPWRMLLRRDRRDGTLGGRISTARPSPFADGTIRGRMDGEGISGQVVDAAGNQLGSFTGTVSGDAMSGTFESADGDYGTWRTDD